MQVTPCYKRETGPRKRRRRPCNTVLLGLGAVCLALVAAGCGGGGGGGGGGGPAAAPATTASPTSTAGRADPGRAVVEAFLAAARRGDAGAMWALLSTASRERLGPTLAAFRSSDAKRLAASLGGYRSPRVLVSERITSAFGVVGFDGQRAGRRSAGAVALRLEGTSWKLELEGPVRIRPIGPAPGAREAVVAQVAAAVEGPGGSGTAVMYLDGLTVSPTVAGTSSNSTLYANLDPALDSGRHTVVVFASDGGEASALAWAFTVRRRAG
jgi:hypothetical protein